MEKIKKWLIAHLTNRCVWRVTYLNGDRTYLICKDEAKGIIGVWPSSTMWIDYEKGDF